MAAAKREPKPKFFRTAAAFGRWLEAHAHEEAELLVGFRTVGSGEPSLTWPESVDEALRFGWIDGVRRRLDERSYSIRFTPRREGSVWSAVNIAKAQELIAEGRMHPAGLAAFAKRTEAKSGIYAYEHAGTLRFTAAEERRFRRDKAAWRYYNETPPGYRRTITYWVVSAKREATRAQRLDKLIAACAAGERLR